RRGFIFVSLTNRGDAVSRLTTRLRERPAAPIPGALYGTDGAHLYTIDPETAQPTMVGALFAAFDNGNLYRLDKTTGSATLVGFNDVHLGLAFAPAGESVPGLSWPWLGLLAVLLVGCGRLRQRTP
ncbi:MAG: hypothetical protein AAFX85_03025, partial [Pseudomonadota bacterium]